MRAKPFNPTQNQIPKSIKEENLIKAIETSGYPLQGVVASKLLKSGFHVTEEWGFRNRDNNETRNLDLAAYRSVQHDSWTTVGPSVSLLIECKKSIHPYIFFRAVAPQDVSWFPYVAGLPHGGITIVQELDGVRSLHRLLSGAQSFGLDQLPFVVVGPDVCAAFSRAEASGDRVILSGSDPFNAVIMPLANASDHALHIYGYRPNSDRVYPRLLISVAVLDAPMLLVESPAQSSHPVLTPWVRVTRQEPNLDQFAEGRFRHYGVDVVHVDFFDTFIESHVLPFANEFGKRAIQLGAGPMINGGRLPNVDAWDWNQISEFKQ